MNVVPMTAQELEAAVLKPAERAGVKAETALLAELIAEMADRPGGLPMLQYALTELFDQQTDATLTLAGYRRLGGLRGILSHRAEVVYSELGARGAAGRDAGIPAPGAARRRRRRVAAADSALRADRSRPGSGRAVERASSHSGVIGSCCSTAITQRGGRPWRLRTKPFCANGIDWPAGSTATGQPCAASTFHVAVDEWELSGRDPDYLLTGSRLAEFESWSHDGVLRLTGRSVSTSKLDCDRRRRSRRSRPNGAGCNAPSSAARARASSRSAARWLCSLSPCSLPSWASGGTSASSCVASTRTWRDRLPDQSGFDRAVEEFEWVGTIG